MTTATATIRLNVLPPQEFQRVMGQIANSSRRANAQIAQDARQSGMTVAQIQREQMRRETVLQRERERSRSRESTHAETEARKRAEFSIKQQERAQKALLQSNRQAEREEQRRTRAHEREERQRTAASEREQRQRTRIEEREERVRSRNAAREFAQRQRAVNRAAVTAEREGRSTGRTIGNALVGGASALGGLAGGLHADRQQSRQYLASSESTLNSAFYQAGADVNESRILRQTAMNRAQQLGLSPDEVAQALAASQTEFSTLGRGINRNDSAAVQAQRRATNLESVLSDIELARNTFQSTAEVTRVGGLLTNAGITGGDRRNMMLALTGMAQQGAIELGAVSREAMAPMQARMAQAVARLSPAERNNESAVRRAQQSAVMQTFAELEVGRSLGMSPRWMGQTMSNLNASLTDPITQDRMLTNIESSEQLTAEQRTRAVNMLYEDDPNRQGHRRLRSQFTDGLGLARGLQDAFNGDSTLVNTIFHGGGHGNPQSLQANWRRVISALVGAGAGGENDPVAKLMQGVGTDFTEADVRRGASLRDAETQTDLQRQELAHARQMTGDSAPGRASDWWQRWRNNNPIASGVLSTVGGGLGSMASAAVPALLGKAGAGLTMTGMGANIAQLLGVAGRGLGMGAGATVAGYAGVRAGEWLQDFVGKRLGRAPEREENTLRGMVNRRGVGGVLSDAWDNASYLWNNRDTVGRELSGGAPEPEKLINPMKEAFSAALRETPIRISPIDAAHLAGVAATGPNAPPMQNRQ